MLKSPDYVKQTIIFSIAMDRPNNISNSGLEFYPNLIVKIIESHSG